MRASYKFKWVFLYFKALVSKIWVVLLLEKTHTKKTSWTMRASVKYLHFVSRLEAMSQLKQRRVAARYLLPTSVPTLIIYALWYTLASVTVQRLNNHWAKTQNQKEEITAGYCLTWKRTRKMHYIASAQGNYLSTL